MPLESSREWAFKYLRFILGGRKGCRVLEDLDDELEDEIVTELADFFEEGVNKLTSEQIHNLCHNLEKTVSREEFCKACELYQEKLFGPKKS